VKVTSLSELQFSYCDYGLDVRTDGKVLEARFLPFLVISESFLPRIVLGTQEKLREYLELSE
jgi:hypothetical protein